MKIRASLDSEARWYAGDFHVHTRQSGDGPPQHWMKRSSTRKEEVGMDFVMLSEHNTNSGLTLYGDCAAPSSPVCSSVPGVEWTTYAGPRQCDRRHRVGGPQGRRSRRDR